MAVFKCKMCGAALEISAGTTVIECEYCGTQQTLPKLDDDRKANLYDRANHFRRNNEFDKAMGIYENILNEDNTDAEAYWSLVLCRYGIEYVEDPTSRKRIPTVNRAQFTSIFDDDNYKSALQYADSYQKAIYEQEAKAINEIQKGILAISQKEEPFDVFICYKESDNNGRRTPDSVLAQDLYYQLTQEGFKVFFARITLEDKLGSAYEPYIFAALNSAKVMVAMGTKPEHFKAVWVRNEWSRYLSLIKQGQKKMLIPAYKDMDPYDLPEEFSHLQAQDMSKLGFMQDLIRGIKKILEAEAPKATVIKETVVTGGNANTAPLLKRVFMFLEDGDWSSANEYCEKVLDIEPECAEAYLGKLMVNLKVKTEENLGSLSNGYDDNTNYQKVMRFGNKALQTKLAEYNRKCVARYLNNWKADKLRRAESEIGRNTEESYKKAANYFEEIHKMPCFSKEGYDKKAQECYELAEGCRKDIILNTAARAMQLGKESDYNLAIKLLCTIPGWKDADQWIVDCQNAIEELQRQAEAARLAAIEKAEAERLAAIEKAEANKKDAALSAAAIAMKKNQISAYQEALALLEPIFGWKDAAERIATCRTAIAELEAKAEEERLRREEEAERARKEAERKAKRNKKIAIIVAAILCICIAFVVVLTTVIIPNGKYNDAIALMESGKYAEAIIAFEAMNGYKDSAEKIDECQKAITDLQDGAKYDAAVALMEAGKYEEAMAAFEALNGYKDSTEKISQCKTAILDGQYSDAVALMEAGKYDQAIKAFKALNGHKDSAEKIDQCETAILDGKYNDAVALMNAGKYEKAITAFKELGNYKDSKAKITECNNKIDEQKAAALEEKYNNAVALMNAGKYNDAITAFKALGDYKDSKAKIDECNKKINDAYTAQQNAILDGKYNDAVALMNAGKYSEAIAAFKALGGHKDSASKITQCETAILDGKYNNAVALKNSGNKLGALTAFSLLGSYKDSQAQAAALRVEIARRETISAGLNHTVGLKTDGTVVAVGNNLHDKRMVSGWKDIVAISAGGSHTVGLKADGTVVAVGNNYSKQCNVTDWTDIIAISAGDDHTVGLKADGTVVAVGYNHYGQCNVSDWKDMVAISAGDLHTVGLKADGTVVAVGRNYDGECNVSVWKDIVAISAGDSHTVGLKADGTVVAVGENYDGECDVSGWKDIVAISAGGDYTVGLKTDGTVVAVGDNYYGQCDVSGWKDIVAISTGDDYTLGLKADGTVVAVGDNSSKQCNVTNWTGIKLP